MERTEAVYQWSVAFRINHWAVAAVLVVLIVTGFYIASPFTVYQGQTVDKFLMGRVRFFHLLFGIFLTFLFVWRIYLAFFSRFHADWKDFMAWIDLRCMWKQMKFYMLIEKEGIEAEQCAYGYTQSFSYLVLWFMTLLVIVTGLMLMGAEYHAGWTGLFFDVLKPVGYLVGGLAVIRYFHHALTWFFILFIMVHIYMAVWHDVVLKHGIVSSMISGWVFKKISSD